MVVFSLSCEELFFYFVGVLEKEFLKIFWLITVVVSEHDTFECKQCCDKSLDCLCLICTSLFYSCRYLSFSTFDIEFISKVLFA